MSEGPSVLRQGLLSKLTPNLELPCVDGYIQIYSISCGANVSYKPRLMHILKCIRDYFKWPSSCVPSASCNSHCQAHSLRLSRISLPYSSLNSRALRRFHRLSRPPRTREVDPGQPDSVPVVHNNAIAEQRFERKSPFMRASGLL